MTTTTTSNYVHMFSIAIRIWYLSFTLDLNLGHAAKRESACGLQVLKEHNSTVKYI